MSDGWRSVTIQSTLAEHFSGAWGDDPMPDRPKSTVLRSTDIDDQGHVDLETGARRVLSARERGAKGLHPGDILLEASGGGPGKPVGRPAWFAGDELRHYTASNFFKVLRPNPAEVDGKFLLWKLLELSHRPEVWQFQQQTTGIINLKFRDYLNSVIRIPSVPEQRHIAEILDDLDDQLLTARQIIEKLRVESRALLTELMLHGMGIKAHHAAVNTNELDESSLPLGWSVATIDSLLASVQPAMRSGPFGSALLKHELVAEGIPVIGIDNVKTDRFIDVFTRHVTQTKALQLSRYLVRPRDVLITIMGTVGRSCLVPDGIGGALSSKHVWTITLDQERYIPYLASRQLNHAPWARAHLRRDEQGGIMSAIRSETLRSLRLPVPSIDEQREIADVLQSLDRRIDAESERLRKLRLLKEGLSADLLAGRVRVPAEVAS